jgi:hypothetical protein
MIGTYADSLPNILLESLTSPDTMLEILQRRTALETHKTAGSKVARTFLTHFSIAASLK